jgi:hypothetical protein
MRSFPPIFIPPGGLSAIFIPTPGTQRITFSAINVAGDTALVRAAISAPGTGVPIIVPGGTVTFGVPGGSVVPGGYIIEAFAGNAASIHIYITEEA